MSTPRKHDLVSNMFSTRTLPRGLLCAFLLLIGSSTEASMGAPRDSPLRNLSKFWNEAKNLSTTNTPVNTLQPVCEVLKKNNVTGYSYKQWYMKEHLIGTIIISAFLLIVALLTHTFLRIRRDVALLTLFLLFIYVYSVTLMTGQLLMLSPIIIFGMATGIVMTRDFQRLGKVLLGICLTTLVVSVLMLKLAYREPFSYMDDYSLPDYLVSSTSTNTVVIHEKINLPYGKSYKWLKFRDGRGTIMTTNELATLLDAQAEEIRLFKSGADLE